MNDIPIKNLPTCIKKSAIGYHHHTTVYPSICHAMSLQEYYDDDDIQVGMLMLLLRTVEKRCR